MARTSVVVVGAGASGLTAAGALKKRGIDAVVLEQDDAIGGTWARRYDRLHLHTIRFFSGLAHYPIPRRFPRYLARDEYVSYLQEYARELGLNVVTGCKVRSIRMQPGSPPKWTVETSSGDWNCDAVVIATGQYREPMPVRWPGHADFRGDLLHSSRYTSPAPYVGKRVLVVGSGNSGTEIATDLAEHGAASVALSIRTTPPIVPRDPFGMPIQRTGILLSFLPSFIADRLARLTSRLVLGDLTRHGLQPAEWMPYESRRVPVIDVGFVSALKRRAVTIRPAVDRLTQTGAVFTDGTDEPFDAIIAATGFRTGLEDILEPRDLLDEAAEPIARSGDPTARPGIYFIGFLHSLRGHLFESNLASRRLASHISRYLAAREPGSVSVA